MTAKTAKTRRRRAKPDGLEPQVVELDNGLRAFLIERSNLPIVASTIWYRVGSRDERTGETGCSHLLEHMMFKGTGRYAKGEIDLLTGRMGGSNNAFTDQDATAYYFALAADRWESALEIERSRMTDCLLDPAEFEAEKRVVLEELAMYDDDPWNRIWLAGEALAYQVHPYHHPIIGWKQDLERLPVEGLRSYYERHYAPNRAFLVVAGAFDPARTEDRIRELFGDLPAGPDREPVLAEPPQTGERRARVRTPGTTVRLAMAVPGATMGSDDDFTLDVLAQAMAGGRSGRLYKELVLERELVTSVSVHNEARLDTGMLWILAELRPGADPAAVESVVLERFEEVGRKGLRKGEFDRALAQILSSWTFEQETVLDLAQRIGRFEAVAEGGLGLIPQVPDRYRAVGNDAVRDVVQRLIRPERFSVLVGDPEESAPPLHAAATRRTRAKKKPARKKAGQKKAGQKKPAAKTAARKQPARKQPARKKAAKKAAPSPGARKRRSR